MGIKGEGLANSFSSDQIYSWYNGEENHENLNIPFDRIRKVAIIGHGNVALDISRIFLKSSSLLRSTDISPKALQKLSESKIDHVEIIGRRGPLQVIYIIK